MQLYLIYNKNNLRNLFFSEKIMKPDSNNSSFDYKKQGDKNTNVLLLYNKVPRNFINDENFILKFNVNLKKINYTKIKGCYVFFNNLYLDDKIIELKKIYYPTEKEYKDLISDVMFIREAKYLKKYKSRMEIIKYNNIKISDEYYDTKKFNVRTYDQDQIEFEKSEIYDSLKGLIIFTNYFYPKNIVQSHRESRLFYKISNIETMLKSNQACKNKKDMQKILNKDKKRYLKELKKEILQNRKYSVYLDKQNKVRLSFNKNVLIKDNDLELIECIINMVIFCKIRMKDSKEKRFDKILIGEFGKISREKFGKKIYDDTRILYSLIVNRRLELNYKNINNEIIRFLYLALEYKDNINSVNAIVRDYKFDKYPVIYAFIGVINGFEKMDKIFADNQKLDIFEIKLKKQLEAILQSLEYKYGLFDYYKNQNKAIISKIIKKDNYYKMIDKLCLHKKSSNITFKRLRRSKLNININNKYKVKVSIKRNNEYGIYTYSGGEWHNVEFNKYDYCYLDDRKLTYDDEIKLNEELRSILDTID